MNKHGVTLVRKHLIKTKLIQALFLILMSSLLLSFVYAQNLSSGTEQTRLLNAEAASNKIEWANLTPGEKTVLAPYESDWNALDAKTQAQLQRGAARWQQLSPEQRQQKAAQLARWQAMSPEQRAQMRARLIAFRELPIAQRQRIKQAFERFNGLAPEQRAALVQRFQAMTVGERKAFLLALNASSQSDQGRRVLNRIPKSERRATIEMMRGFTPEQRLVLKTHLLGLAPAEREALRKKLLSFSTKERTAFLQRLP